MSIEIVSSLESRYEQVYRKQGIRFVSRMSDPILLPVNQFEEIDHSVLHYFFPQEGRETYGIARNNPLIQHWKKNIGVYHVTDYFKVRGNTRKRTVNVKMMMRAYHKHHNQLFWLREEKKINSFWLKRQWAIICDYSLMGRTHEYKNVSLTFLNKFETQYESYLKNINHWCQLSPRKQLVVFHVPDKIPDIARLKMASKEFKRAYWNEFDTYEKLVLLDFWKWLDPNYHQQSILGNSIDEKNLNKIEFLFYYKGHATLINLELIYKWATGLEVMDIDDNEEGHDSDDILDGNTPANQSTVRRFQRRFLVFLNAIVNKTKEYESRNIVIDDKKEDEVIEGIYDTNTEETLKDSDIVEVTDPDKVTNTEIETEVINQEENKQDDKKIIAPNKINESMKVDVLTDKPTDNFVNKETTRPIILDLVPANKKETQTETMKPSQIIATESRKELQDYAVNLNLTEREVQYWNKQLSKIDSIPSPFDKKKSLRDFIDEVVDTEIKKEDIQIPDIPLVMDKTMLESSLIGYREKYAKEMFRRDVVRNICAVQKAGVAITDYSIEEDKSIASDYEVHVVQFTPIGGSPSTARIRVPKIAEDGTITKGGKIFNLKNLRRDLRQKSMFFF